MRRPQALVAVMLTLGVCACGDPRRDFVGSYGVSGTLTTTLGSRQTTSSIKDESLEVVADAFDSDKLYLDFDCGLSGTMSDEKSFRLDDKVCPAYADDECRYLWHFNNGQGSRTGDDAGIGLSFRGTISVDCSDGSSGVVAFILALKGTRLNEPLPGAGVPGGQSLDPRASGASLRGLLEGAARDGLR
ncbi:hypothetical protein [Vitiosangium sp. GDMCC 1.1324]|uniref:hypothetical protein n=1 Tax=Vitiosangium sp. (strain GDMCC 1.1324) TaxID=2138576 RepID=UPI000D3B19E6|nr:hypothetical protein [Vitiosangium sp. GDMCC 1.1324]PTL76271.1 hypothetical protein DAT35_50415 [Vitiosangium sp. GDMCC 1.1324]